MVISAKSAKWSKKVVSLLSYIFDNRTVPNYDILSQINVQL